MWRASDLGQGARKDSFNASSQHDQSDLRTIHEEIVLPINATIGLSDALRNEISDLQQQLSNMARYIQKLNVRITQLERKLENENNPIFSSQSYQTDALLRPEAIALDKKSGSHGLSQPLLHLQRDLEDLSHLNYPSDLSCFKNIQDSLRSLVKTELAAIIEESVRSVIENNNYQLLPSASEKIRNTNQCQGSEFNAQRRQTSQEVWHNFRFPQKLSEKVKPQPDAITPDKNSYLDQRDNMSGRSEPLLDVRLHGNTRETKVCAVGPFKATTDDNQLNHVDNTVQDEASKNVAERIESPFSTEKFKQQLSIDTKIADESVNTFDESQQATSNRAFKQQKSIESRLEQDATSNRELKQQKSIESMLEPDESDNNKGSQPSTRTSIRTLNQQMSLEGMLEPDEDDKNREMHPATRTSSRTLDQQMSLEGMLETDETASSKEMHPAISRRTLNQQMSLEGQLEVETDENVITETRSAVSARNLQTQLSFEGKLEEATSNSTTTEMQPTISTLTAKMFSEVCTQDAKKSNTLGATHKSSEACTREGNKSNTLGPKTHKSNSRPKSGGLFRKKHKNINP